MSVEVRNVQTQETYAIGDDGAVFGREGGGAGIQVADRSVSKKHARVFTDGTEWFLEDMGSVNGTIVDGNKIGGAVPLRVGLVFSLSKFKFEIVRVPQLYVAPPDVETRTSMRKNSGNNNNNNNDLPSELRKDQIPRKRQRDIAPPRAAEEGYEDDYNQAPPPGRNNNLPPAVDNDYPSQTHRGARDDRGDEHDGYDGPAPQLGIDQYEDLTPAEAVTRGIGYVLKTTPLLAINPIGTVRNHLEDPPLPALEKLPLAALVAPALVAVIAIQQAAGAIAGVIVGAFSVVAFLMVPVVGVIGGAIGALITGFIAHPILGWLVDKLGGQSDARTRTAHVGLGMVANVVLLVPMVLTIILTAVIARLMTVSSVFSLLLVIPALLSIIATPLPIYVQWQFFKSYGVAKWFQTLLMIVAALAVVGALVGAVGTVVAAVKGMGAGGSAVVATGDGTVGVIPTDGTPPVVAADSTPPPVNTDTLPAKTDTPPVTVNTPPVNTPPVNTPPVNTTKPPVATPATKVVVDDDYAVYERKRAEIEAIFERDPTLLVREPSVKAAYETLLTRSSEAEDLVFDRFNGRKRPSALNPLYDKSKKAEVYEKTKIDVNKLHRLLFGS